MRWMECPYTHTHMHIHTHIHVLGEGVAINRKVKIRKAGIRARVTEGRSEESARRRETRKKDLLVVV